MAQGIYVLANYSNLLQKTSASTNIIEFDDGGKEHNRDNQLCSAIVSKAGKAVTPSPKRTTPFLPRGLSG